jgi:hypothetical protein
MQLPRAAALALLPIFSGCYGAVGPTVGLDLQTGRPTLGVEGSGETLTLAHSVALGTRPVVRAPTNTRANADPKDWSTHTYLLWEPGFGGVLDNETSGQFTWLGGGGSLGLRLNRYDEADSNVNLVVGAWLSGGRVLVNQGRHECGDSDTRPFAALVVGIRGFELYASPKIGVMHVPGFCLNIFDDGESF